MNINALQKEVVTDTEIGRILALRETQQALKKRLDKINEAMSAREEEVIAMIASGAEVISSFEVSVKEHERRFPRWKEEYISQLGKQAADVILERTPPKVYQNLCIK